MEIVDFGIFLRKIIALASVNINERAFVLGSSILIRPVFLFLLKYNYLIYLLLLLI